MKCPLRFSETGGKRRDGAGSVYEESLVDAEGYVVCSAGGADGEYRPTWDREALEVLVALAALGTDAVAAVLDEREACAALIEEMKHRGEFIGLGIEYAPEEIAKAIRARSETTSSAKKMPE